MSVTVAMLLSLPSYHGDEGCFISGLFGAKRFEAAIANIRNCDDAPSGIRKFLRLASEPKRYKRSQD